MGQVGGGTHLDTNPRSFGGAASSGGATGRSIGGNASGTGGSQNLSSSDTTTMASVGRATTGGATTVSTNNIPSSGGSSPTAGGSTSTGGTSAVDGTTGKGGASSSTGGTVSKGGATALGGSTGKGGASSLGGAGGKGGMSAVGGTNPGIGGTTATTTTPATGYHTLAGWASPSGTTSHHGTGYFLANGQKDENGMACTSCHGANFEGGSGPACASCHSTWRSTCTFCHGTSGASAPNPPYGVAGENSTSTLGVGRHTAHLTAGSSHLAFACNSCHVVPATNDITHTVHYKMSADLSTPGHHGDITFSGSGAGMTWNVAATTGTPVSARGTCSGSCHSNGRGGAPVKTPYWAGGAWTNGCGNCHATTPTSGHHNHALSNGATCADCHTGATTTSYANANHMNGTRNYNAKVAGQSMTLTASGTSVRCNGACHGNSDGHSANW